jgi:hypothetical protein
VRGQNMLDDFSSDFCSQEKFIDAIKNLISNSNAKYVIMSYYGGRNHWNHWSKDEEPNDVGFNNISMLFKNEQIFKSFKAESLFQKRQNYQSRVGEKKQHIDEYLFFGERQNILKGNYNLLEKNNLLSKPNEVFGLDFFKTQINEKISLEVIN